MIQMYNFSIGMQIPQMLNSTICFWHQRKLVSFYRDGEKEAGDQTNQNVFGPSLNFAGQPARWIGDGYSYQGQVGIEGRVTFETYSGDRVTSYLYIVNDGTTAVYYDWKVGLDSTLMNRWQNIFILKQSLYILNNTNKAPNLTIYVSFTIPCFCTIF